MDELLTSKQVQDLLKVDRTTIYRMLKDGRLVGIKVGDQWRFSPQEIESLLSPRPGVQDEGVGVPTQILPLHCIQPIQDVFAEVTQVGSVTTGTDGEPLTQVSNSCGFCNLILGSETGRHACAASWRELARKGEHQSRSFSCHAGLQYAGARIEVNGEFVAVSMVGQFYAVPPDPYEESTRIQHLAQVHQIDAVALAEAARALPVLDKHKCAQLCGWLETVAHTFEQIAAERSELMGRLQRIAEMSTLSTVTVG
jgi:excisionase family DNA binding protein